MAPDDDKTQTYVPLTSGTMVSHYRIIEKIGAGGMGEVYLAEDIELKRKVALKFLAPQLCQNPECRARFMLEARAAARLNHPGILVIHEVGEYQNNPYFVMEYIEGQPLSAFIKSTQPSLENIISLAVQMADGLNEAHLNGIIHRDIKPGNILIDKNGRPKILDFGLAAIRGNEPVADSQVTLGTIAYMSPEQSRGETVDHRSDIFSFGSLLYEMITGKLPFPGEYEAAVFYAIAYTEPEPLTRYRPNIPQELQNIIDKALKKDPAQRYQEVLELIDDLKAILKSLEPGTIRESPGFPTGQPSIAVLPFSNLSADKEQEYFCDGMAEEIINALSAIEGLFVVARTSAFSYKGKVIDIREIGRKLGVGTVLEGSVRKAGQRLRITSQLIDVASGYHLWSEKFDRDIEDIFVIQDEISLAIVENLKVKLLAGEKDKLTKRYTVNPEAYSLYLKGRYFWNRRYEGGLQKGIECFEQAIAKDPLYAPAYVGIADCYNQYGLFGFRPAMEAYERSKRAVARALEIDDTLSEAYSCLGWINTFYDWEWAEAEKAFLKALKLNPHSGLAHNWYGLFLAVTGRIDESVKEGDKSLELDPVSLIFNAVRGLGYYWTRENDKGIELLKKTLEMDPGFSLAHLFLGLTYAGNSRWEDSIAALKKFIAQTMNSPIGLGHLGLIYGLSGNNEEARQILNQLTEMAPHRFVSPLFMALAYMGIGDVDRAFDFLYKAAKERDSWIATLRYAPFFDPFRSDSRYKKLLMEIGLGD